MPIDPSTAFVSYSREDSEFVQRLAKDLKARGAKIWMDQLDIRPGQRWEAEIEAAVDACSRMLVILSPAAIASKNVLAEAALAIDERKEVIPVLYQDCKIPFRLRPLQYSDFRSDYATGMNQLILSLGGEHSKERTDTTGGIREEVSKEYRKEQGRDATERRRQGVLRGYSRQLWTGIAVVVILVAGWILYQRLSHNPKPAVPAPTGSATAEHTVVVNTVIEQTLKEWASAIAANNVSAEVNFYGPVVDPYYLSHNVTRQFIQNDKQGLFDSGKRLASYDIHDLTVSMTSPDEATVLLTKVWRLQGSDQKSSTRSRLHLKRFGNEWKIVGEQDLR